MKSIAKKLTTLQIVCAVLVVAVLYTLMERQLSERMTANFVAHGNVVASALAKSVEPVLVNRDMTSAQSVLDATLNIPDVAWAYVAAPDGKVLAHTFVPQFPEALKQQSQTIENESLVRTPAEAEPVMVFKKPALTGIVGNVYVGFSRAKLISSIHTMELVILLSTVGVMLVITLAFMGVIKHIVAPVRTLTKATEALGHDGHAGFQDLPVVSNDEIGVLTNAFNRMAGEIREQHETLEARVRDRTQALSEANDKLAGEISERRKTESALRESSELVMLLLDATPEAIYGIDTSGNCTFCNPSCLRLLGYQKTEDLLGKNMHTMIHHTRPDGTSYPVEECHIFEAFRNGTGTHIENEVLWRSDGSSFPAEYWSRPINNGGKLIGSVVTFIDVTQRRQEEKALRDAKEAADTANHAKSTFLATMSHEIRTPMNGILGMTELVLDTELTSEQREHLGLVRLSAESLLSIINDILDFSKIEAGKFELETIPFDLRESLGETMKALSFRAHQKGIELIYEVEPEVPEALLGDPGRIRQILINLVGNGIKFTERGEILVSVQEESSQPNRTSLHFSVKDSGVGIPLEKQGLIFEAFSQADGSMARKYGGTGLGLTICKRLTELMGGRVWLESQPGQGSTFHFVIQVGVQENTSARRAPVQPQELRDLHVLIVDDNFTNRRVLEGMLSRWGMRPTAVEGGRAALQALHVAKSTGHPFPLILLDGQMPEMDGFTLAEIIYKDPSLVGATIMMLTSAGHVGDAARCRELGISAYLVKPVRQGELLEAICALLQKAPQEKQERLVTKHTLREDRNHARILLAEDNVVNQKLALRLLEKRGFAVTVAGDGRAVLAELEKGTFDVILMDVQMPEMDGFEATAAIRAKEKSTGGHIPIVAMTAHALKGDQERCLAAGMDGYVSKPIRTNELFTTIEGLMGEKRSSQIGPVERTPEAIITPN
jgi:two-component system, sensor histidine kinase and response regulator